LAEKPTNHLEFGNTDMMPKIRMKEESSIPKGKKQHKQRNHVTEAQKQISSQETVGVPPQDWTSQ
jgi:hypothetical protein